TNVAGIVQSFNTPGFEYPDADTTLDVSVCAGVNDTPTPVNRISSPTYTLISGYVKGLNTRRNSAFPNSNGDTNSTVSNESIFRVTVKLSQYRNLAPPMDSDISSGPDASTRTSRAT